MSISDFVLVQKCRLSCAFFLFAALTFPVYNHHNFGVAFAVAVAFLASPPSLAATLCPARASLPAASSPSGEEERASRARPRAVRRKSSSVSESLRFFGWVPRLRLLLRSARLVRTQNAVEKRPDNVARSVSPVPIRQFSAAGLNLSDFHSRR